MQPPPPCCQHTCLNTVIHSLASGQGLHSQNRKNGTNPINQSIWPGGQNQQGTSVTYTYPSDTQAIHTKSCPREIWKETPGEDGVVMEKGGQLAPREPCPKQLPWECTTGRSWTSVLQAPMLNPITASELVELDTALPRIFSKTDAKLLIQNKKFTPKETTFVGFSQWEST